MDLAWRCQQEGNSVRLYIHSPSEQRCGDGLVPKVRHWQKWIDWADLVVFDDVRQKIDGNGIFGPAYWRDEVRKAKKPYIGGSPLTDKMENDRIYGQQIAKECGLPVVPMERFTDWNAGRKFIQQHGGGWALKHNGQVNRDLGFVKHEPDPLLKAMDWLERVWDRKAHGVPVDFVLQEAQKGVEIAVTGLFDGNAWHGCYVNQEIRKLMSGDYGPSTGQTGEIGLPQMGPLWSDALYPLTKFLREQHYHGCIDLNCIAQEGRIVPLEWTTRFGYPTVSSIVEMIDGPVSDWLWTLATGEGRIRWHDGYCATIVVASGPFPREEESEAEDLTVMPDPEIDMDRVHWNEVEVTPDGEIVSAGSMGYLAVVTAQGRGAVEARNRAYRTVKQLEVMPFAVVRDDVGDKWAETEDDLRRWGWLK